MNYISRTIQSTSGKSELPVNLEVLSIRWHYLCCICRRTDKGRLGCGDSKTRINKMANQKLSGFYSKRSFGRAKFPNHDISWAKTGTSLTSTLLPKGICLAGLPYYPASFTIFLFIA